MQPQFFRNSLLLGADGVEKLSTKSVAVFGVGGVGSFAVEALARGGIGQLFLVDNDTVDISNINRQLPALLETVGQYKTHVLAKRIAQINPLAVVRTLEAFCLPENIHQILTENYDYILDAVDTVSAKLAIAEFAYNRKIPVISCMGAGNKLDPTMFQVSDIYSTSICPLCRVMRHELKKREVGSLKVVYSKETPLQPDYSQLPLDAQGKISQEESGRRSTPGSVSFVPPVAGMIAGGEIIKDLLKIK